jgi:hypothetical protein
MPFSERNRNVGVVSVYLFAYIHDATRDRAGVSDQEPQPTATLRGPQQSGEESATGKHSFIRTRSLAPNVLSNFPSFSNASITLPNTDAFSRLHCTPTPVVDSTILS